MYYGLTRVLLFRLVLVVNRSVMEKSGSLNE